MSSSSTLNYTRPWVYPKQEAALFHDQRFGVVEATTKSGKTAGAMIWLTEQALNGRPGQNFWWVAPVFSQTKMVFRRLKEAMPRELYIANETELTLNIGGRMMWFKSGDNPDALYGEDVYGAVVDEATRCKPEAWYALSTTLSATRGPVRIIGNVKGKKNWAYMLARQAQSGAPNMHYAKLTADDAVEAGIMRREAVDEARMAGMPEPIFRQLYYAEPADDEGNPFGIDAIRACIIGDLSPLEPAIWGWDLAKSRDWTVGIALDIHGHVCRFERWNKHQLPAAISPSADYWEATVTRIRALTQAPAMVDSTGLGDPVFEAIGKGRGWIEPYPITSTKRKQQLMEGLAVAIQQHAIRLPPGIIQSELEAFEYEFTRTGVQYAAPEGLHDDCVCALALAVARWQRQAVHDGDAWMALLKLGRRRSEAQGGADVGQDDLEDEDDLENPFDDGNTF